MILSGTGFHKGIPDYSKHNSPSSMTGDHTMMAVADLEIVERG